MRLVFPNRTGRVQNYSNIYNRVFKPMLVANDIVNDRGEAKFGIHALRHSAASLLIEQFWNPKKIKTLLGHASITMTMDTYGHLFESLEVAVSLFEKLETDLLAARKANGDVAGSRVHLPSCGGSCILRAQLLLMQKSLASGARRIQ